MKKILLALMASAFLMGCHKHREHEYHAGPHAAQENHGHGDDAQSFSGATHKEGKGITLLPETKERLDVRLDEVTEKKLPIKVSFNVRVFARAEKGQVEASGIVAAKEAETLREGLIVSVQGSPSNTFTGQVTELNNPVSTNETEVVVRFTAPPEFAAIGSTCRVTASTVTDELVTTVPKEALIKGTTESFVYVQNENAYLRTVVTPGRETEETVEVKEGLLEGDFVVSKGAMDLWLVELRAVKGGQGCCPAPPAKGKGK